MEEDKPEEETSNDPEIQQFYAEERSGNKVSGLDLIKWIAACVAVVYLLLKIFLGPQHQYSCISSYGRYSFGTYITKCWGSD